VAYNNLTATNDLSEHSSDRPDMSTDTKIDIAEGMAIITIAAGYFGVRATKEPQTTMTSINQTATNTANTGLTHYNTVSETAAYMQKAFNASSTTGVRYPNKQLLE
jgi:hypothetical protein